MIETNTRLFNDIILTNGLWFRAAVFFKRINNTSPCTFPSHLNSHTCCHSSKRKKRNRYQDINLEPFTLIDTSIYLVTTQ